MVYNYPNGYVHVHTDETIRCINNKTRSKGRIKERYNVCLRDGKLTPVHENCTFEQVKFIKKEIEKQGNKLW